MVCSAKWKTCDCPWFNYSQLPDADRLQEMRVPQPIQIIYRRAFGGPAPRPVDVPVVASTARQDDLPRQPTYMAEMDQRRRQERLDEDLARRLQLATLIDPDNEPQGRRRADVETWGLGNAAGHFMNDDFVQNAANVVMSAFGDATLGRRGDRSSGRRRRARPPMGTTDDAGLVPDFLGDASVLGVGPTSPRRRTLS